MFLSPFLLEMACDCEDLRDVASAGNGQDADDCDVRSLECWLVNERLMLQLWSRIHNGCTSEELTTVLLELDEPQLWPSEDVLIPINMSAFRFCCPVKLLNELGPNEAAQFLLDRERVEGVPERTVGEVFGR